MEVWLFSRIQEKIQGEKRSQKIETLFTLRSKTLSLNKNNEKNHIGDFSFTCNMEYVNFNMGAEKIKSGKQGPRLEMDSPPSPKTCRKALE